MSEGLAQGRYVWDLNQRPFEQKALNLPISHHATQCMTCVAGRPRICVSSAALFLLLQAVVHCSPVFIVIPQSDSVRCTSIAAQWSADHQIPVTQTSTLKITYNYKGLNIQL